MELPKNSFDIVSLDLTYKCNYRCLHCYNSSGTHNYAVELSDNQISSVVNSYIALRPRSFCICGGEPMMRKELLYKIIRQYFESEPVNSCNMVSNGFFIDEKAARELKQAGINSVQISLDGATAKSHNWLRNNDEAFMRAIKAIQNLRSLDIPVSVACTPTKINITEIDELINLCLKYGVMMFRMQPIMNLGRGKNLKNLFLNNLEYMKLSRKLLAKSTELEKIGMRVEWGDPISHLVEISAGTGRMNFLHINAYGDIQLSPYLPINFGNIKKHTLDEYFDKGLEDIIFNKFVQKLAGLISSANEMSLSEAYGLPDIFTGNDVVLDVCDDNVDKKTEMLLKKYNL